MNVFVIIATYNASPWIKKCLDSIINSTIPLKILVIDNRSTDDTIKIINTLFPTVEVIESEKNVGFGRANNIGIKKAIENNADYVFLLNQDAWVNPETIEDLISLHKKNEEYGILSPMHLNGMGTSLDFKFSLSCNAVDCPGFMSDNYLNRRKDLYQISFVNAALWLISKECLIKVGGFDPLFPHYGEDRDFINRVVYHSFKVGISPDSVGFHDREDRPFSKKRDRIIRHLGYLCDLKDINRSFFLLIISVFPSIIWRAFKFACRLKIIPLLSEIKIFFKLLLMLPEILISRKVSAKASAYL